MAEQDRKKSSKLKKIGRVLKWIGLTLLAILIILALFFQTPWKVIALLLIVLAACTVLPKPYRKWFWLSVAAIVVVLIIWVFLPEDNEGWRPYTFDEELAALQAKYAIPDSQNAATIYNELLEEFDPNTRHPDFLDPNHDNLTLRAPWSSRDYPELAKWLQQHQKTITKLFEASKVEKCAFPIPHDTFISFSDTMEYLPEIRGWAFLLVRAGNNDMAEGRIEEGLEKYLCVGTMGDHMRQQSTIIEMLVGFAVKALALGRFKAFVVTADATEEHLNLIEKALADIKYEWTSDFPRILGCEKLMFKNFLGMFYVVNSEGKIRLNPGMAKKAIMTRLPDDMKNEITRKYWQRKLIKVSTIWAWFYMPSSLQKAGEIIDAEYEKYYAMTEPDFDWQREPPELPDPLSFFTSWYFTRIRFSFNYFAESTIAMEEGSYYRIHDLYLRNIAEQRGARVIIALRRYKNKTGQWPQMLDDIKPIAPAEILVDPINGGSFVYKLTEENFTLYSKGKNNIDEDGNRDQESGADDWLIWPTSSRKSKKEKANDE